MRARQIFASVLAAAAIGVSGLAFAQGATQPARTPAETVDYRHSQFRRIGQSFKAVNDGLRASNPDVAALRTRTQDIAALAQALPTWFPAGTATPVGDRNRAKADIWSNAAAWNEQVRQFQTAATGLAAAADVNAMRAQVRAVQPRCASCHNNFRVPD